MNKEVLYKYLDNKVDINNVLDYQIILSQLKNVYVDENDLKEILPIFSFNDDEIIVTSDTHYGSIYENYDYIRLVYDFAKKNNIRTIINGGDFIQGTYRPLKYPNRNVFELTEEVLDRYPYDESIHNYILLGNHDYTLLKKSIDTTFELFQKRDDIKIMGLKQLYIKWKEYLVFMYHYIPKVRMYTPRLNTLIKLYGHHHDYNYTDDLEKFYLPSLCGDVKYYGNVVYPGFLKLKLDEDLEIRFYPIANNKIYDTGISLRKELKDYDYFCK